MIAEKRELSVLIVDDETPARRKLRRFLDELPENIRVSEAKNGLEAVQMLEESEFDLLFLDIQMPELDGLEVVKTVTPEKLPLTIFTTAFDEYAVKAFELEALDYLLKPFDIDRFKLAFRRALERFSDKNQQESRLQELLHRLDRERQTYAERLVVKERDRIILVPTNKIQWISTEDKYLHLHTAERRHLIRSSLADLEERLDPAKFRRIHRSYLVNVEFIEEIHPWSHGDYVIILKDKTELPMSRRFSDKIL